MKLVNLTPHPIALFDDKGKNVLENIAPSGVVARCERVDSFVCELEVAGHSVPVYRSSFGEIYGLPEPQPDTVFIVSALSAQAVPERQDVLTTSDPVRDEAGRIIGCRAFAHV